MLDNRDPLLITSSTNALAAVVTSAAGDALSVSSGSAADFAKNIHQVSEQRYA